MKTTTIELTPETLAAFVNLCHLGCMARGLEVSPLGALVKPLLEQAQTALNEQGNGVDVIETEKAKYAETHIDVADVETAMQETA